MFGALVVVVKVEAWAAEVVVAATANLLLATTAAAAVDELVFAELEEAFEEPLELAFVLRVVATVEGVLEIALGLDTWL